MFLSCLTALSPVASAAEPRELTPEERYGPMFYGLRLPETGARLLLIIDTSKSMGRKDSTRTDGGRRWDTLLDEVRRMTNEMAALIAARKVCFTVSVLYEGGDLPHAGSEPFDLAQAGSAERLLSELSAKTFVSGGSFETTFGETLWPLVARQHITHIVYLGDNDIARHAETVWADVLLGAFFEAGYGSLATSREVTGTTVWGNGDTHYTGGGLLARIDLTRGLLRGLYVEGSGRAGEVATSWNSDDLLDNLDRPADYDLSTPYYGGHAGLGYRLPLGETWTLDVYGKYLFTHQNGQETGLHGDSIHFDAVDSSRLRLGARLDGGILPAASVYMGAAWEYEYLGTARAASRTSDMSIPSTTMTGSSALFELGLAVTPETAPLRLDLALEGAAGTRRSIGGRVQLVYEF